MFQLLINDSFLASSSSIIPIRKSIDHPTTAIGACVVHVIVVSFQLTDYYCLASTSFSSLLITTRKSVNLPSCNSLQYTFVTTTVVETTTVNYSGKNPYLQKCIFIVNLISEGNCATVSDIIGGVVGGCTFVVIVLVISIIAHIILVMVIKSR